MTPFRQQLKAWVPPALVRFYRKGRAYPHADVQFTLPVRTLAELFHDYTAEAVSIPFAQVTRRDEWAVPAAELLTIAAICALIQPQRIFEIGTYTGESTRVMAWNTASATKIHTLDLDPDEYARRTGRRPHFVAGSAFHGAPEASKIHQHTLGPSGFDFAPFEHSCDLVFVDADHSYAAVKADSAQAFRLLRPGGTILWDDYTWDERHPECAGVTRYLNELSVERPIVRVAGTRFALYTELS